MVSSLSVGDEVVTAGGLLGKVTDVGQDYIEVEIANGTVVKAQRNTIGRTLPKGTIKSLDDN